LQQFLARVEQVNNDPYFLGRVTRVVLFGSMLKPEVERLSDVDLAVELASKEEDFDRMRARNYECVEELCAQGHRFRNFLEQEGYWYGEVFGFLQAKEPCHRFSGLLGGEDVRADRSAPIPHWPAGTNRGAIAAKHAGVRSPEAPIARLPILRAER
jgi:hypothetical protein